MTIDSRASTAQRCRHLAAVLLALVGTVAGCSDQLQPVAPATPPVADAISDGAHDGGNPEFFFLPPLAPAPERTGEFDGSLAPVVQICEWTGSACVLPLIAEFTSTPGSASETVHAAGSHYLVEWHTKQYPVETGKTYRITVRVAGVPLGFVDVAVVGRRKDIRCLHTGELIPLVDGSTLPIRFRIDKGAVVTVQPGVATSVGPDGGTLVTADGKVTVIIPPGALAQSTPITVNASSAFPVGSGPWTAPVELGPTGTTFAVPATLVLSYDPTQLPSGVPASALAPYASDGTGWQFLAEGSVDSADDLVSVPIAHFSTYTLRVAPTILDGVPSPTSIAVGQTTSLTGYVFSYLVVPGTVCFYGLGGRHCYLQSTTYKYPVQNEAVSWSALPAGTQVVSLASSITHTDATGATASPLIIGLGAGAAQVVAAACAGVVGRCVQSNPVSITVTPAASHDVWTQMAPIPNGGELLGAAAIPPVGASDGLVLAVGGVDASGVGAVKAFDPMTNTWVTRTPMDTARQQLGVAVVSGIIYAIGGGWHDPVLNVDSTTAFVEAYDPAAGTWSSKAPMPTARYGLAVAVVSGRIYAIGGATPTGVLQTVEMYDPGSNTWTSRAPMPTARYHLGADAVNGVIYAVGGVAVDPGTGSFKVIDSVEAYDPVTDSWTTKASMPTARADLGVVALNGLLYALGGGSGSILANNEVYDPARNTWSTKAPIPAALADIGVAALGGVIYVVGGNVVATPTYAYQP